MSDLHANLDDIQTRQQNDMKKNIKSLQLCRHFTCCIQNTHTYTQSDSDI